MKIAGVDEAGRGPVIGPMVMAGVVVSEEYTAKLKELGVKDSKKLSPKKRQDLFQKIIDIADNYKIVTISPSEIDSALLSPFLNLNLLEANKTFEIISSLDADKYILDCPSANPESYLRYLFSLFDSFSFDYSKIDDSTFDARFEVNGKEYRIVAGYKADDRFVEVSAASILAKVTRDRAIESIKEEIGIDFGSGYPSDPKTRAFLEKHWKDYDFFRKTWQSWKRYKNANASLDSFK